MITKFSKLPVHGSGDDVATGESLQTQADCNCRRLATERNSGPDGQAESAPVAMRRDPAPSMLGTLHHPYVIAGTIGIVSLLLLSIFVLLPVSDLLGRVLCMAGIVLSQFVGAWWFSAAHTRTRAADNKPDVPALSDIDQKMEQLEDAKWQLNDSAARYRDLLDQHQDMIVRTNASGQLVFANRAFCRRFEIDLETAQGQTLPQIFKQAVELPEGPSGEGDNAPTRQVIELATGGCWIEWQAHRIFVKDAYETQYTGRDVSESVQTQLELEHARDQAQIADRSKSRFLASMSHEIRTPMNGILGMASLLDDEQLTDQQRTYLDAIEASASNLLAIIDEILDFSKIEAGKIQLSENYFSIDDTVQSVAELLAPSTQEKGLELAWTVSHEARGEFLGDAARVRQVLINLISNAIKFTDHGGIRVAVTGSQAPSAPGQHDLTHIEIRVSDTGIGLTDEEQKILFSEFGQTDQAIKRQSGGTGLGLAISRRLAQAMGGDLSVEQNVGPGSTFVAKLVLKPVVGVSAVGNNTLLPQALNMKVLLAFDLILERAALAEMLNECGIPVVECALEEAQSIAEQARSRGAPFTRIVVDAEADPSLAANVFKTLQRCASDCGLDNGRVRGSVLVGISSRDGLAKFKKSGFDSYLVRPVRPRTFFEQLISERVTPAHPEDHPISGVDASDAPQRAITQSLRFLVVEDNDINALMVEHQLQRAGHTVCRVTTGLSALERIEQTISGQQDCFDFVLMDVLLPEMDGLEATGEIIRLYDHHGKTNERPPVIALTANAFEEDRVRCLEAGMDDYLAKPFDQEMLEAVLVRCLTSAEAPSSSASVETTPQLS